MKTRIYNDIIKQSRIGKILKASVLIMVFVLSLIFEVPYGVHAEGNTGAKPQFSLKKINNGTGVRITIQPFTYANRYNILITKANNAYSSYICQDVEHNHNIGELKENGNEKRTYTIKGLPKGTYSIAVEAVPKTGILLIRSEEKKVKISAPKEVEKKTKQYDFSKAKVGDIITFGSYEQDDDMNNGQEDIEWIVLGKTKKDIFVISKYILDTVPYHNEWEDTTWEKCTLRKWLNKVFYNTAFTKDEQAMIKKTALKNSKDENDTKGGKDTKDRIYLLSTQDILDSKYGFSDSINQKDINKRTAPTEFALVQGTETEDKTTSEGKNGGWWWLRTPGNSSNMAASVSGDGSVNAFGTGVFSSLIGVRPVMHISLKSK